MNQRAQLRRMFSEFDFAALRAFAALISGSDFATLFHPRVLDRDPPLQRGPYTTAYLEGEPGSDEARDARAEQLFVESELAQELAMFEERAGPLFTSRRAALCTLTAQFLLAVAPEGLSSTALRLYGVGLIWMFAVDDGVDRVTARINDLNLPGCRIWYPLVVRRLVEHHMSSLEAGLRGEAPTAARVTWRDAILIGAELPLGRFERALQHGLGWYMGEGMRKLYALGGLLHRCGLLFRELFARPLGRTAQSLTSESSQGLVRVAAPFVEILSASLLKKVEEVSAAPTSVDAYYVRHSRTSGTQMAFEFGILITGLDRHLPLLARDSLQLGNAMEHAYRCVLLANESCFYRDIGKPEESLVAVMIADALRETGPAPFLGTQRAHGKVLRQYGHTPAAFAVIRRIYAELRAQLFALLDACETLLSEAPEGASAVARCIVETLLRWAVGYHLLNPTCSRYGQSFAIVEAVLRDDYAHFRRLVRG